MDFVRVIAAQLTSRFLAEHGQEYEYQDSASHSIPVDKISPCIWILSFMLPISSAQSELAGTSRAIGFPCFVMRMPSGSKLSSNARHCSLNFEALILYMTIFYD